MPATPAFRPDNRLRAPYLAAPFASTEIAWFWTASALKARQEGTAPPGPGPCRPDDVVKCLDALYRQRRIDLLHVRILRTWGWKGIAPNSSSTREHCDWRVWHEALGRLDWPLRMRGIVVEDVLGPRPAVS